MKNKKINALKLNPERLRRLTDNQLRGILGGDSNAGNGTQKTGFSTKVSICANGASA